MECFSSSTTMEDTFAGASAPITNWAGSSDHSTMSTRSSASSLVTAFTRVPRTPTQGPIGSTPFSRERTATLAPRPGARAGVARAAFDLQQALFDLGHFLAEQFDHEFRGRARQNDGRAAQAQVD